MTRGRVAIPPIERICSNTCFAGDIHPHDPELGQCWEYLGTITPAGYGRVTSKGRTGSVMVHRIAFEYYVRPISEGMTLDHTCGNKCCWNLAHLEEVTSGENAARYQRGRRVCKYGHPFVDGSFLINKNGSRVCKRCGVLRVAEWVKSNPDAAKKHWDRRNELVRNKKIALTNGL